MRRRRELASLVALTLVGAVAACGGPASSETASTPEVTAGLVQYREDDVAGRVKIVLTSRMSDEVVVQDLRLAWPGLEEVDDARLDSRLRQDANVALPVGFGSALCDAEMPSPESAEAVVVWSDGSDARIPITSGTETLSRLWERDCTARRLAEAVQVSFGAPFTRVEVNGLPTLRGPVVLERGTSDEDVVVDQLQGSVLLDIAPSPPVGSPYVVMAASSASAELLVDVQITGRCSGHALGESKKTYFFEVFVGLGDDEPVAVSITPDDALEAEMLDVLQDGCQRGAD